MTHAKRQSPRWLRFTLWATFALLLFAFGVLRFSVWGGWALIGVFVVLLALFLLEQRDRYARGEVNPMLGPDGKTSRLK